MVYLFLLSRCDTIYDWDFNMDSYYNSLDCYISIKSCFMGWNCRCYFFYYTQGNSLNNCDFCLNRTFTILLCIFLYFVIYDIFIFHQPHLTCMYIKHYCFNRPFIHSWLDSKILTCKMVTRHSNSNGTERTMNLSMIFS